MPAQDKHDDEGWDDGDEVGRDGGEGAGDGTLNASNVVGDARDDFTRTRTGEEAQAHALKVIIELRAQVTHDALADPCVEKALSDAEEAGD